MERRLVSSTGRLIKKALLYRFYSWVLGPFWGAIATENATKPRRVK